MARKIIYQAGTTPSKTFQIKDGNSNVSLSGIDTITLTLYNYDDQSIINTRDAQDVKNTNNVAVTSGGLLTWSIQEEDTVISDSSLESGRAEPHVALFEWTYTSSTKTGRHEFIHYVRKVANP